MIGELPTKMLTNFKEDAEPLESFFELNDTLFAKAQIPQTEEVYLWLGVRQISSLSLIGVFQ